MTIPTAQQKIDILRLFRTENIGPITFQKLLARYGSATRALEALPHIAQRGGKREPFKVLSISEAQKEIEQTEKYGARLLFQGEAEFPTLLTQIYDCPPIITVKGRVDLLNKPSLAIVGARNASLSGQKIAGHFAQNIGKADYVIISGLARGIDTAAHEKALPTGTVAVLAGGIDHIYPRENEKLYHSICTDGCVVAESPFATEPLARHFPKRNRIISGLSLGTLVIEARLKSGSLITARTALEQNRDVFAVPGSPLDDRAEGCNELIQNGAYLAQRPQDIISALNGLKIKPFAEAADRFDHNHDNLVLHDDISERDYEALKTKILSLLNYTPLHGDDLVRAINAPTALVLSILMDLEIAGFVMRTAYHQFYLKPRQEEGFLSDVS